MGVSYHYDLMQGSEEWLQLRLGMLTASEMHLLLTPTFQVANNEKVRNHMSDIVSQRATQFVEAGFESYDMQRGSVEETWAKDLYGKHYGPVKDCGFVTNDRWGFTIGASPDGLVDPDGGIEGKSRTAKYQLQTILSGEVPSEFMVQIQTCLLVTERKWWDFISYSNGMPMFVKRVLPNKDIQGAIVEAATTFETKAKDMLADYLTKSKDLVKTERREHNIGSDIIVASTQTDPSTLLSAG